MTEQNRRVLLLLIWNSSALLGYRNCHAEEKRSRQAEEEPDWWAEDRPDYLVGGEQITRPDRKAQDRAG
jgi:hypothetical protein